MVITMFVLPLFNYPSLSLCGHRVITVLCDLQIFSCPVNRNVTHVSCAVMLKTETSGVLINLGAICHRLEASSMEVTFGAIRYVESSRSNPALLRPRLDQSPTV
jgi:hypothetical protein